MYFSALMPYCDGYPLFAADSTSGNSTKTSTPPPRSNILQDFYRMLCFSIVLPNGTLQRTMEGKHAENDSLISIFMVSSNTEQSVPFYQIPWNIFIEQQTYPNTEQAWYLSWLFFDSNVISILIKRPILCVRDWVNEY